MPRPKPDGYNVRRNLDEIRDATAQARKALDNIDTIILARRNHELNKQLYRLARALAEIDRKARNARQGEYEP
jgi:hypothetical protein